MAVIAQTNGVTGAAGPVTLTETTTTSSDTLTYYPGGNQRLILTNTTGTLITVTMAGTTGTTGIPVQGMGLVNATGGKAVPVPANSVVHLSLDLIGAYLAGSGSVTLTGGAGLIAVLYV